MATLGGRIRTIRMMRRMSVEDLALAADVSTVTVGRLELDRIGDPRLSTVRAVAVALGVPLPALLYSASECSYLSREEQETAAGLLGQGLPASGVGVIMGELVW